MLSWGHIQNFYSVLDEHAVGYNSSTYSLRHQGSDINTEETAEKNITKNSIFPMQAIPQVEGLAITALRGYWPLLQSCGDCFLFISVIFFMCFLL